MKRALVLVLAAFACNEAGPATTQAADVWVDLAVPSKDVVVLSSAACDALVEKERVVTASSAGILASVRLGSVLVSEGCAGFPDGFLWRVTGKRDLEIEVEDARLDEAFDALSWEVNRKDAFAGVTANDIKTMGLGGSAPLSFDARKIAWEENAGGAHVSASATVSGSLRQASEIDFDVATRARAQGDIDDPYVFLSADEDLEAKLAVTLDVKVSGALSGGAKLALQSTPLATVRGPSIDFVAGGVPVHVRPNLRISAACSLLVKGDATIRAELSGQGSAFAWAEDLNGDLNEDSEAPLTFGPASVKGKTSAPLELSCHLVRSIAFTIYGRSAVTLESRFGFSGTLQSGGYDLVPQLHYDVGGSPKLLGEDLERAGRELWRHDFPRVSGAIDPETHAPKGGLANTCSTFDACGGNIDGTWTYASGCLPPQLGPHLSKCPGATSDVRGDITGKVTIAGQRMSRSGTLSYEGTISAPASCFHGCAALETTLRATAPSAVCTGTTTCTCKVDSTVDLALETTFTRAGARLDLGNGAIVDVCEKGNTLGYAIVSAHPEPPQYTLTR